MSDRPIAVGDLVVVVRPQSCGCSGTVGRVFVVAHIQDGPNDCSKCGRKYQNSLDAWGANETWSAEVSRLKRIPPLDELEGTKTDEPLKEPA